MSKISVIVPAYNSQDYIEKCINSIINQSFKDFTLIIVDDGSTDKTAEICDKYAETDSRVKVVHKKNSGVNSAVIEGVNFSDSDYTVFCDSDDMLDVDNLKFFYNEIENTDIDGVRTGFKIEHRDGKIEYEQVNSTKIYCKEEIAQIIAGYFEDPKSFTFTWSNSRCGKIYKTEILKSVLENLNKDLVMGEDLILNLLYLCQCQKIKIVNNYFSYLYIPREGSATHNYNWSTILNYDAMYIELEKFARENNISAQNLALSKDKVISVLICDVLFSKISLTEKIKTVKEIYKLSIKNRQYNKEAIDKLYFAIRPGVNLIISGHVIIGTIVTVWSNNIITFLAKIFLKNTKNN